MDPLRARRAKHAAAPYVLIAPAVVLIAVFLYGVVSGVLQGFGIMPFLGMNELTLDYWAEALSRPDLLSSIGFSLYLSLVSAAIALVGGTALCAALSALRAPRLLQLLDIQIPLMTAHTLVVLFVVSLFAGSGLVPRVLYALGLVEGVSSFPSVVGDPTGWGILLVYAWKEIPFVAFTAVALMSNVSDRFGEGHPGRLARAHVLRRDAAFVQGCASEGVLHRVRLRVRLLRSAVSAGAHAAQGAAGIGLHRVPRPRHRQPVPGHGHQRHHGAGMQLGGAGILRGAAT